MQAAVRYDDLSQTLTRIGYTDEPAEVHGALCGALCVLAPEKIDPLQLLPAEDLPPLHPDAEAQSALARLREQSLNALQDSDMAFAPLLPDDEEQLAPRVRALAAWCGGFLYGLSSRPGLKLERCSEDAREIIQDFTQFTRASVEDQEDVQMEEDAYIELVEYVRIGAQLIFMEFRPLPVPDPSESHQLH